jgi:hypothetical protein
MNKSQSKLIAAYTVTASALYLSGANCLLEKALFGNNSERRANKEKFIFKIQRVIGFAN